jgi:hypothetical protein
MVYHFIKKAKGKKENQFLQNKILTKEKAIQVIHVTHNQWKEK